MRSTTACRMPPRSKDLTALRTFAAQHAAAHAKAATLHPNAACHCRAEHCAAHEETKTYCAGAPVLILRHDPVIGRVWSVEEVCETCAPLIPHTKVIARPTPSRPPTIKTPAATVPAARTAVAGGFSSPGAPAEADSPRRRPHRPTPRHPRSDQAR
ncbi:hypothetical protein [Streptomyces sp. NPDC048266]|uniref:hypothetical protein n=1 Tax=Streptomyces sp. NPDC048266 TaxID=3155787 RepID=UPI0033C450B6